ncbi:PTS system mannose-specific IIC component [Aequitasia blattaphilus]|uniref:PTS sugar transporter subunit IIC n=1 Tax=Aequitasia blattaphilus TaxID=2949332 RepID=A0ABT1EBR4_9FIRM|nr:PTS sugar transporter subunit IIC [Aequitasia blattaphilus]MCP1103121.1 PTS sugar transporter subunit IIC [Aequitasia blattaphilus]MCR8615761.1 PTS sugar transporter subunit IIC [Aequitasia blattaphilus]
MLQALLIALWAGICSLDDVGPQMIRRPLLTGTVTGLIMGDLAQGLTIGASLELMWMGIGNVGAYSAPDLVTGAIIGTALGISSGGGVATGIALAVPVALLAQQLLVLCRTLNVAFVPWAQKTADKGDFDGIMKIIPVSALMYFLARAVPCFIAVYFGSDLVSSLVDAMPTALIEGLGVASKIVPAIGIALLLMMMLKNWVGWVFLLLGFTLSTYLELSIMPIAIISLAFAVLYVMVCEKNAQPTVAISEQSDTEEEYDL